MYIDLGTVVEKGITVKRKDREGRKRCLVLQDKITFEG